MMSNGGVATPATARRFPVRLIESGPAAGALMSSYLSQHLTGRPHVLSFDMGGTTAKGALIRDRMPLRKYDLEVARVHAFKKGSGLPLKIPVIDMIEIGAGGGGIARGGPARGDPARPAQRRGRSRPRLLWPQWARRYADGRQSGARLSRPGVLPGRQDAA